MKFNNKSLFLGITGDNSDDLIKKIEDINRLDIDTVTLFLQRLTKSHRDRVYEVLEDSVISYLPMVHIKNDMYKEELKMLEESYGSECFTIHEESFDYLDKWHGYLKDLYLEFNFDNSVLSKVAIERIGGFCVDISHFKVAQEKWSKEFEYILDRRKNADLFKCNHLNGYSYKENTDLHMISSLMDFDYLKSVPDFIFGDYVGLEVNNSISEQLGFVEYLLENFS